jgi:hypothetical protein
MAKKFDVVATTGFYMKDGVKKYINKNVGSVIETEHGLSIKLDASFNPSALQRTDDGMVWLKLFEPKENRAPDAAQQAYNKGMQQQPQGFNQFDDGPNF